MGLLAATTGFSTIFLLGNWAAAIMRLIGVYRTEFSVSPHIIPVDLDKAFRLINHGPTVLVSAAHQAQQNVMAAAWVCPLDFDPPKLTIVLDKCAATRRLVEASGEFVVQIPNAAQVDLTQAVGTVSLSDRPEKMAENGVQFFSIPEQNMPFVEGCSAWLACRLVPELHNQTRYDLFIADITAAWADDRVFRDGHWQFEHADPKWRSLHHVAGGHFYAIGDALKAKK